MIKKREMMVTTREVGSSTGDDFLEILLKAHHDANPSRKISVQDMVDECKLDILHCWTRNHYYFACVDCISPSNPH